MRWGGYRGCHGVHIGGAMGHTVWGGCGGWRCHPWVPQRCAERDDPMMGLSALGAAVNWLSSLTRAAMLRDLQCPHPAPKGGGQSHSCSVQQHQCTVVHTYVQACVLHAAHVARCLHAACMSHTEHTLHTACTLHGAHMLHVVCPLHAEHTCCMLCMHTEHTRCTLSMHVACCTLHAGCMLFTRCALLHASRCTLHACCTRRTHTALSCMLHTHHACCTPHAHGTLHALFAHCTLSTKVACFICMLHTEHTLHAFLAH